MGALHLFHLNALGRTKQELSRKVKEELETLKSQTQESFEAQLEQRSSSSKLDMALADLQDDFSSLSAEGLIGALASASQDLQQK
jgi:hypothetical protein